jgi:hypothetical protein
MIFDSVLAVKTHFRSFLNLAHVYLHSPETHKASNHTTAMQKEDDSHQLVKFPRTRHIFDAGGGVGRDGTFFNYFVIYY